MKKRALALLSGAVTAGVIAAGVPWASAGTSTAPSGYEPVLNPKDVVKLIDNPYFRCRWAGR